MKLCANRSRNGDIRVFIYFQHGFVSSFWTTHDVHLMGNIFPAGDAIIQSDVIRTLRFYVFAHVAGKCLVVPFWDSLWRLKLRRHCCHRRRYAARVLRYRSLKLVQGCLL